MRLTPNDINVLLHYYTTPVEHERVNAPEVGETVSGFLERGILREATLEEKVGTTLGYGGSSYRVTEKGEKLVRMLCATPDPVQKWLDPRCEDPPRHEEEMRWIALGD